ncbi:DNA repair and recombination protein RadA [Candidatus Parvarchaeota archaeon]|uniref:DNA repair and recombination protein RadA n=2 Tax=Candidatus Acidifodinimicrobium mancum TaxID=2898728 RepID=A0A8T3UXN9_9ARCH|nr:DNA repair and recombination protein RadA [Candidatus Acidifodinimicrobium mancum]MBE5728714.1 DNA repair and recombination protein RadA [Candidatus Acidifodinimicrobium mancum]MBE5729687.1 DNA repair and recombination protein RadA [Candidatus Acidifodinimicrobium mancum]MBE5730276.1 DNA repair and recombination protein RadA [Candidatus Acidifodinimicrobium mancum]
MAEKETKVKAEDNGEFEYKDIKDLEGVGSAIASKLKNAGYVDIISLATANPLTVAEVCEIGETTARKIIAEAREEAKMNFMSGLEFEDKRKQVQRITTGSKALDILLGGGVETQAITEFYGEYGSGKSQVAFQLSINAQLPPEKGGLGGHVIWIDTEGTFRPSRVEQLAIAQNLDPKTVLENIKIGRAYSSDHQILLVDKIPDIINADPKVKLVIVDSMMALFRAEYVGRGTLADRQQKVNVIMHNLQRLADRFNLAVYVTNQVMARPDVLFGDPTVAVGGHIIGHVATYRVYLRKGKKGVRVARLVDSPNLPEGEATFEVTSEGVKDAEEKEK